MMPRVVVPSPNAGPQAWAPLLDPVDRRAALGIALHIAEALREPPPPYGGRIADDALAVSLFSREPGFALFYGYLARATGDPQWRSLAQHHMQTALDRLPDAITHRRTYFGFGITGMAWALEHLSHHTLELEPDALDDIDELVGQLVESGGVTAYNLRKGLVGYAVYCLERLPRERPRKTLEAIATQLVALAEPAAAQTLEMTWRLPLRDMLPELHAAWPDGMPLLGVIDGAAGPLAVLERCLRAGIAVPVVAPVVEAASRWLWAQSAQGRLPGVAQGPRVPPALGAGELGIAAALRGGASYERAVELALAVARDPSEVRDSSLLLGSAGVAHAFARLHAQTGDPELRDAARQWYARTIAAFDPARGFGGYQFWSNPVTAERMPDVMTGWVELPGLGFGAAGVGLALLAATTEDEPAWDRIWLLSARPSEVMTPDSDRR